MIGSVLAGGLAAAVLLGGVSSAWGQELELDNRNLRVDPSAPASKEYERTLEERNRDALEDARERGDSHFDTTFGTMTGGEAGTPAGAEERERTSERRPLVPEIPAAPAREEAKPAGKEAPPEPPRESPQQAYEERDEIGRSELPELIGELLKVLDRPPRIVRLTAPPLPEEEKAEPSGGNGVGGGNAGPALPPIEAGSGLFARVLYTVDSDHPGPVLLQILEPPLNGAVVSGSFQRVRERMVVRLESLAWRGQRFAVEAWAVGLDCACYGLRGDVDRHWWERLILPAAVNFAQGFLTERGRGGRRVEVSGETVVEDAAGPTERQAVYAGLGGAVRSAGEILLQDAPGGPTVRIPRDAEVAVVFARPPGDGGVMATSATPDSRGPSYSNGGIRRLRGDNGPERAAGAGGTGGAADR